MLFRRLHSDDANFSEPAFDNLLDGSLFDVGQDFVVRRSQDLISRASASTRDCHGRKTTCQSMIEGSFKRSGFLYYLALSEDRRIRSRRDGLMINDRL